MNYLNITACKIAIIISIPLIDLISVFLCGKINNQGTQEFMSKSVSLRKIKGYVRKNERIP